MVDAIVSHAIENLGNFISQEVNIRIGVRDSVIWLKDELDYLRVSIRVLESQRQTDHIRLWINSVRDIANQAVIILDRFTNHQEEHAAPKLGVFNRVWSCICICKEEADLYGIGKEIESLTKRLTDMKNRRDEYKINDVVAILSQNPEPRRKNRGFIPYEDEVEVVGFEDDVKTLLAELVREDPSLCVISIHGMGGLGKTTLARKLYDSSELCNFQRRSFVCVSQQCILKDVLRRMIKSIEGPSSELEYSSNVDEIQLLEHLRNLLEGQRYLVVIDDIWKIEDWKDIRKAFPDKRKGSRVILTTRNESIAHIEDHRCFVHELHFLSENESWQLFSKKAKPTRELEKLGKEMVGKCGGLPLAIVVLSGLLLQKKGNLEDWEDVKNHLWRKLKDGSSEIRNMLSLSYDDLSFPIQQCFLYLARFPEDHIFEVDKLMKLWIAEEFISVQDEGDGVVMEDVAKEYLNELIKRNMIQVARLRFNKEVGECRVHDLVRDFAIEKAREQKLLGVFNSRKHDTSYISLLHGQPRHIIYNEIGEYLKLLGPNSDYLRLPDLRHLCSLALINNTNELFKSQDMKSMYTQFKYLKVLDLTSVKSDRIPQEIGDLVHLKFLGLIKGDFLGLLDGGVISKEVLVIPPTLGKLKNLQTLCGLDSSAYKFPIEMCKLKELRHLSFGYTSQRKSRGSFNISNDQTKLQTLGRIWYKDWIKINSVHLTNLRTLILMESSREENAEYTLDSIANLTSLRTLVILFDNTSATTIEPLSCCKHLNTVYLYGKLKDVSELRFLPDTVTSLTLARSEFTQDPMPILGSLSYLTTLDLTLEAYIGQKMMCSRDDFPSLQFFRLSSIDKLEELQVEDGALPSLIGFNKHYCQKLKISPQLQRVPAIPKIITFWEP